MIKQIGAKIYYCKLTGNVIELIGEIQGFVTETTFEEDCEIYNELKERDKNSIGLLQFEYGKYFELSKNSTGVKIDLKTLKPIFTYEELPTTPTEPTTDQRVQNLETENEVLKQELTITQDAINELILLNMSL